MRLLEVIRQGEDPIKVGVACMEQLDQARAHLVKLAADEKEPMALDELANLDELLRHQYEQLSDALAKIAAHRWEQAHPGEIM